MNRRTMTSPDDRARARRAAFLAGWDLAWEARGTAEERSPADRETRDQIRARDLKIFCGFSDALTTAVSDHAGESGAPGSAWVGRTDRGRQVAGETYGEVLARLAELRNLRVCDLGVRRFIGGARSECRIYETVADRDADARGESAAGWFARIWQEDRAAEADADAGSMTVESRRIVVLASGGSLTITLSADMLSLGRAERELIFGLIDQIAEYERDHPGRIDADLGRPIHGEEAKT